MNTNQQIKYAVTINGIPFGNPQPSRLLAESLLMALSPEQRALAEIKVVTSNGSELLLG